MAQLRHDQQKFSAKGAVVLIVGPENAASFRTYFQQEELPFVGLPDPKATVLRLYGQEVNLFKLGRMPAQLIVDRQGMVRFVHYGHSMGDIPENDELFELLDTLDQPETLMAIGQPVSML